MKEIKDIEHELLSPIRSGRIFEEVSDRIKELIFEGIYNVGDQLPTESQLAQTFNVGRQTVREALRMLESSGFIKISRGVSGGPLIEDTILKKIGGLYTDAFRMRRITFEELTVARIGIEKVVIDLVLEHIDEKWLDRLHQNIHRAKQKVKQNLLAVKENLDFHRLLAKATGNQVFVIVLESVLAIQGDFLIRLPPDIKSSTKVTVYHEKILSAIESKQKEETYRLLEEHLKEVEDRLSSSAGKNHT